MTPRSILSKLLFQAIRLKVAEHKIFSKNLVPGGTYLEKRRPYRSFVSYIDRSRDYYAAQGYTKPYAWSYHREVPFTRLSKPLSKCRVGALTTAGQPGAELQDLPRGKVRDLYALGADPPPPRLVTEDLSWDKNATQTDDLDSFLPLSRLSEYAANSRIGSTSARFYGVPTTYSRGKTLREYAPQVLKWCREDAVDAILLSGL